LKNTLVVTLLIGLYAVANAQSQHSSGPKAIKGSGCVENAVEHSCHVVIDSKTGETYNLLFDGKVPKAGTAIRFSGAEHLGMTTCMQGKPVNVSKWKKEKGIKCPPQAKPGSTH
jgi:hypothetical protein